MVGSSARSEREICCTETASAGSAGPNGFFAGSLSRRCISTPWPPEAKILKLQRNREEIIFSLRAPDETYIENNSSQPRKQGKRVSHEIPSGVSRSANRSGAARRRRRPRADH